MAIVAITLRTEKARKALKEIQRLTMGQENRLSMVFTAVGLRALRKIKLWWDLNATGQGEWKPLGPITLLLRRRGPGPKAATWDQIQALGQGARIMRDSRILEASFTTKAARGSIFELQRLGVVVGSKIRYAQLQHEGGQSEPFVFDAAAEKRFEKNVAKINPGRKAKRTAGGKKSHAKRNWNPMFFIALNWLRGKVGTSLSVPARRLIPEMTSQDVRDFEGIFQAGFNRLLKAAQGGLD